MPQLVNNIAGMPNLDFVIRKANLQDLPRLAELHCSSFGRQEHVPIMLGQRYVMATYRWLVTSDMTYVLVAEAEGAIKGLVAVADRPFTNPMFKACAGEFILSIFIHPGLLFKRKLWKRLFRRPALTAQGQRIANYPGMAQMTIGAVDSACRGKGMFCELVKATCVFSKERASRAVRAGVYKTNWPSRRVFIKCGWLEAPALETSETVDYIYFMDPSFRNELGLSD